MKTKEQIQEIWDRAECDKIPSFQDVTGCPEGAFKKTLSEKALINAMNEYYIRKITKKNIEINRLKNQIKMLTQPTLDAQ